MSDRVLTFRFGNSKRQIADSKCRKSISRFDLSNRSVRLTNRNVRSRSCVLMPALSTPSGFAQKIDFGMACERPPAASRLSPSVRGRMHSPPDTGGEPRSGRGSLTHPVQIDFLGLLLFYFFLVLYLSKKSNVSGSTFVHASVWVPPGTPR